MGDIKDIIIEDYNTLKAQVHAPVPNSIKKVLHPQTIKGHAESGHGLFRGVQVDLSFKEIFETIGINPAAAAKYRELLCYEPMEFIDDLISGKTKKLTNRKGSPLFRFSPLENITIQDKSAVIKGIVLAGRMDSNKWRKKTVDTYLTNLEGDPLIIGHGEEKKVNIGKMIRYGLTERILSERIHSDKKIAKYERNGIFAKRGETKGIEKMFVRTARGLGCCDDLSITSMGLIHGPEAIWGGWTVDAIDTYWKFVQNKNICSLDELVGEYAAHKWKEKYNENIVSDDESMQIIYLGSKNNYPKANMSSSHSRFIRHEKKQPRSTIENHYRYAKSQKRPEKAYKLGFTRLDSNKFYDIIESRFNSIELGSLIAKKKKNKHSSKILKTIRKINGKRQ